MLVYGDPQFVAGPEEVLSWIRGRLEQSTSIDGLRAALIQAGQLEQAVADAWQSAALDHENNGRLIAAAQSVTDAFASAFAASWPGPLAGRMDLNPARACLEALEIHFRASPKHAGAALRVKLPEGVEFYGLYPEQYLVTACAWARAHAHVPGKRAMVIGIRGIGTAFSAVVGAALRAAGWTVQRSTVRPIGHPFDRIVALENLPRNGAFQALIVDEGPGLSGSSLASVAEALAGRGMDPARIEFFPGHRGEPGPAASERTRHWWRTVPRWVTQLEEVNWPAQLQNPSPFPAASTPTLLDALRLRSQALLKCTGGAGTLHDVSGGGWRQFAYGRASDWTAVASRFERPKYLFRTQTGQGVLWKFVGLGAWVDPNLTGTELALAQIRRLVERGWNLQPLEVLHGFMATPWVEGRLLVPRDAQEPGVLDALAAYILDAAGPALTPDEQVSACERLIQLAATNLREASGEAEASRASTYLERLRQHHASRSYGDGRMMPHKWMQPHPPSWHTSSRTSPLLKLDCAGHSHDHTWIGKQCILWDIAGVLVEWELDAPARDAFLDLLYPAMPDLDEGALPGYILAYAAFRLGMITLCLNAERPESAEAPRLRAAQNFYTKAARQILELEDG